MFDLSAYNTFGMHVYSKAGVIVSKVEDLRGIDTDNAIILGKGSDVLFTEDFDGTVIVNDIQNLQIKEDGPSSYTVTAGGGLVLDSLIEHLLLNNITGLENLSAIPGTVGAAPVQNIGAYGVEIGEYIKSVCAYDFRAQKEVVFTAKQCDFGYRTSYFKQHPEHKLFITQVTFELSKEFRPRLSYKGLESLCCDNAMELRNRVVALRREKLPDPKIIGNAGSFFKNPIVSADKVKELSLKYANIPVFPVEGGKFKLAAGWLIDKAGCRGITHGNVGTWSKQALVIINCGQAKPHEVVALAKYIQAEVLNTFNIELEPEVRVFGRQGEIDWNLL